jgi:hypothetical protein
MVGVISVMRIGERIFYLVKCPKCREVRVTSGRNIKCVCGHRYKLESKLAEKQELKLGGIV